MKKSIDDKFEFHNYIFWNVLVHLIINKITVIVSLLHACNKKLESSKTFMIISCLIHHDIVLGTSVIMYSNDHFVYHSKI